jgi:hypothetical protein
MRARHFPRVTRFQPRLDSRSQGSQWIYRKSLPCGRALDEPFPAGHREAGGPAGFGGSARLRLARYRAYLYRIMLTEAAPRAFGEGRNRWVHERAAPELVAAPAEIEASTATS